MTLFFAMLPLYLFGNLHCLGMCGPLVMMIGHHKYRYFYFAGRTLSFSLAGMMAGEIGSVLNVLLKYYHIPAMASFLFGSMILTIGVFSLLGWHYPGNVWVSKRLSTLNKNLSLLILKDGSWPLFLFGFFTIILPCGQTLVVFSACALSGSVWIGLGNGFAFAILTSPSLFFAMRAHSILQKIKPFYNKIMGICAIFIGLLGVFRGMAETGMIEHWIINPNASSVYHIVIY